MEGQGKGLRLDEWMIVGFGAWMMESRSFGL